MIAPRLLVVVAHPDDETFGCGSTLLHAATSGATTAVCCATRGEEGEPAAGSGISVEDLGPAREAELRAAARLMGVTRVELLGYRDSGMHGEPPAGALVSAPVASVAARVAAVYEDVRPHLVLTLDATDGHRDHVHMRDAAVAAVQMSSWRVQRVYLQCLARSSMRRWAEYMILTKPDSPYLDVEGLQLGTPDEDVTLTIDTTPHLPRRWEAIRTHRSQASPFDELPDDIANEFLAAERLRRVVPPVMIGQDVEADLFDGLDLSE